MALPSGCRKVCRPARSGPRKFSVQDVRRIVCNLREQGIPAEEINAAVQECAPAEICDCERLAVGLAVAAAALALAVAAITRRRAAMAEARAAIQRAMQSSKTAARELEKTDRDIATLMREDDSAEAQFRRSLDVIEKLRQDAFAKEGVVVIRPPA